MRKRKKEMNRKIGWLAFKKEEKMDSKK